MHFCKFNHIIILRKWDFSPAETSEAKEAVKVLAKTIENSTKHAVSY